MRSDVDRNVVMRRIRAEIDFMKQVAKHTPVDKKKIRNGSHGWNTQSVTLNVRQKVKTETTFQSTWLDELKRQLGDHVQKATCAMSSGGMWESFYVGSGTRVWN
jgi:hypothetical protein